MSGWSQWHTPPKGHGGTVPTDPLPSRFFALFFDRRLLFRAGDPKDVVGKSVQEKATGLEHRLHIRCGSAGAHFRVGTFAQAVRRMDGVGSSSSACWFVQYGKVIDRRVRELSVESQILPLGTKVAPGGMVSMTTAALHPWVRCRPLNWWATAPSSSLAAPKAFTTPRPHSLTKRSAPPPTLPFQLGWEAGWCGRYSG